MPHADGAPHPESSAATFLNAAKPASQSAWLKLAETMTRTLAVPLGTIGKTIGDAKTPSSNSFALRGVQGVVEPARLVT